MTPDEAIKRLRQELAVQLGAGNLSAMIQLGDKKAHAIQLGIEALERLDQLRNHEPQSLSTTWNQIFSNLPSETKEG